MPEREQYTLRLPTDIMGEVREEAARYGVTVNDFLADTIVKEIRRRRAERLLEGARRLRERIAARSGPQPDSTQLVREMRRNRAGYESGE